MRAKKLGLFISQYNSGSEKLDGFRIHAGADKRGYASYFATPHLAHVRTIGELNAWLAGRASAARPS